MRRQPPLELDPRLVGLRRPKQEARLSILLYGKPGVGKTVLAGTADDDERTAPVLYVSVEGGETSIAYRENLHIFDVRNAADYRAVEGYLRADGIPYRTVIIDSLSVLADRIMDDIARKNGHRDGPERDDWNAWTNRMKQIMDYLRDLQVNVIVTALERKDDDGEIGPGLQGKQLPQGLPGKFDIVGRLMTAAVGGTDGKPVVVKRRLFLQSDVRYMAKDRSDPMSLLPPYLDDPTIRKLLDRATEGRRLAALATAEATAEAPTPKPTANATPPAVNKTPVTAKP